MSQPTDFPALLEAARSPAGLEGLLSALGFQTAVDPVPRTAWPAYGLTDDAGLRRLVVVGRSGSLDALLLETEAGVGSDHLSRVAGRVRARNPVRPHFYVATDPGYDRFTLATFGVDDVFHHLTLERDRVRASDIEALEEMMPANGEVGLELAIRHARALDRTRITRSFFHDFRARRVAVASTWEGVPADATRERAQLALLFLSRCTFLYFLQRRGALAGEPDYLVRLFGRWSGGPGGASFYRARLVPLFFGALNRRPEDRTPETRALGELPYLNGGLFEPHVLERRFPELDLPDGEVKSCFDELLERYRFATREAGEGAGYGVDPEVLGRVFEGLMAPELRGETGSFYTPAPVVNRVVREALTTYVAGSCGARDATAIVQGRADGLAEGTRYRARQALERVRVLDPACGSGAFLLGALYRLALSLGAVSDEAPSAIRRRLVGEALHGVDLLDDAALLCSLRLWLALSQDDDEVQPLPNLDRRIRQGDALVDPLDLGTLDVVDGETPPWHPLRDPELRRALRGVEPAARRYLDSPPGDRDALREQLERLETRLARRWISGARQAQRDRLRIARATAADRDLFGGVPEAARRAQAAETRCLTRIQELDSLATALEEEGALPFFSFGVHFAEAAAGFDLIISNPPWVRAHRWPERIRKLSDRFEVCRSPGWSRTTDLTSSLAGAGAQVDLSLLFVERALRLLAPGGVLAVLVPAKALRALYGGAARRMLLRDLDITLIEDHSLDQRSIFRADAFAAVLVGRKRTDAGRADAGRERAGPATAGSAEVRIRLARRGAEPLAHVTRRDDLPLFRDDPMSPWLIAPPEVVSVFRAMQRMGPPLGDHADLRVRRGIMTGANDVLIFSSVQPKLAGLAEVEAEGFRRGRRQGQDRGAASRYRAVVELDGLRPLVRGANIDAFRYETHGSVSWCHDDQGAPAVPPRRLQDYLERHRDQLEGRTGWRPGLPLGAVFRLGSDTLGPKVAWHDLSDTLRAVALPATHRVAGVDRELVPLNTVYFIPTPDHDRAVLLAGLLNALPVTAMARAVAERAKDARFRFFAWTLSALPVPGGWTAHPAADEIRRIARRAHAESGLGDDARLALDRAAARLYGLDEDQLDTLRRFDAWLQGDG